MTADITREEWEQAVSDHAEQQRADAELKAERKADEFKQNSYMFGSANLPSQEEWDAMKTWQANHPQPTRRRTSNGETV